jgi:hypothetical protein
MFFARGRTGDSFAAAGNVEGHALLQLLFDFTAPLNVNGGSALTTGWRMLQRLT